MVTVNRKRERETCGKMFFKTGKGRLGDDKVSKTTSQDVPDKAPVVVKEEVKQPKPVESTQEYIERKYPK